MRVVRLRAQRVVPKWFQAWLQAPVLTSPKLIFHEDDFPAYLDLSEGLAWEHAFDRLTHTDPEYWIMNPDAIAQAVVVVLTPLVSLIGYFSRRRRLRGEIRDNLSLLQELDKDDVLREQSPVSMWLRGKITIDVAKLSGQPLGTPKKPVPKGSVVFASLLCMGFSFWTYYINRDLFHWYSVFPGIIAVLLALSVFGMFIGRELPPSEEASSKEHDSPLVSSPSENSQREVHANGSH
jgi:hypothetical protein